MAEIPKDREVAELARRAHDVIAEHGHYKGDYWDSGRQGAVKPYEGAPVCTLGALGVAFHLHERSAIGCAATGIANPVAHTADAIITLLGWDTSPCARIAIISQWNDARERTQADVLALLDEVATKAMPDEAPGA